MSIPVVNDSPAWRRFASDGNLRLPIELQEQLDLGRPFGVAARVSTPSGVKSREGAVADLFGALDELAKRFGLDVTSMLPTAASLKRMLETTLDVEHSKTEDGAEFSHRYVELDLRAECGLVILLSTGSGKHLDSEGEQPFIRRAARLVRDNHLALYFCKRFDRGGGRQDWGLGPLMIALNQAEAWLGDEDGMQRTNSEGAGVSLFLKGASGLKQARTMPLQTRREQKNRTGHEFVNGRARYHAGSTVPPGFDIGYVAGTGPTPTERYVFLDCADSRPEHLTHGHSWVPSPDREDIIVDQVANVRWILQHLHKPGWSKAQVCDETIVRKTSSVHFRACRNDAKASVTTRVQAKGLLDTIIANLDLYETGTLTRQLGAGVDPIVITGALPLDGPWASPDDFKRIRDGERRADSAKARWVHLPFTGVAATFNGQRVVMLSDKHRTPTGTPTYAFALADDYPSKRITPPEHMNLDDAALRDSIVNALVGLGPEAHVQLAIDGVDDVADSELASTLARLEGVRARRSSGVIQMDSLFGRLTETDATGKAVLHGPLLERTQAEYNRLHLRDQELAGDERTLKAEAAQIRARQPDEASLSDLLRLVASLRTTTDCQYRHLWISSIKRLQFTTERITSGRAKGRRLSWRGVLEFVDKPSSTTIAVPFEGQHDVGAAARRQTASPDVLHTHTTSLLDGVPLTVTHSLPLHELREGLATGLHIPKGHVVFHCDDPRILRVLTHLLVYRDADDSSAAQSTGETVAFVARVRDTYVTRPAQRWLRRPGQVETTLYELAAANEGNVMAKDVMMATRCVKAQVYNVFNELKKRGTWTSARRGGYWLKPCACGSRNLVLTTIALPVHEVCLDCREDRAGHRWPSDPYDRYLVGGVAAPGSPNDSSR